MTDFRSPKRKSVIAPTMKDRIWSFLLLVLLVSSVPSEASQRLRARPVLKADKEYNAILLHVAQYFVLTIPDDKTMEDIDHAIRCTFVIASDGSLRQLEIENDLDGFFAQAAALRTKTWLRNAVLDGMAAVPPFDMSQIRASKGNKKRTIVFTFGRATGRATEIPFMGFNTNVLDANLNRAIQEQLQTAREGKSLDETPTLGMTRHEATRRYLNGEQAWNGFTEENVKSTMKPQFNPHRTTPPPVLQQRPPLPLPNDSIPKIDIAISLQ